ncbi:Cell division and transport-associated protein TolR [Devosia sp. YR412]|uniref:ExbD/TolR family protein n=1 Tax=Devosia sp. YR412 TaxID=1881030 RepID=UPI0008B1D697|nr:biopolymer transporter ExbD [Devosia sp. YR412]SEQ37132.1 Cell division and transport-associated protein TolR [Devosia sp. YR412]
MGMSVGGSKGGRKRGRARTQAISDINITPMVDVMLVLLIVFMVAAPLMTMGVPIDLPQTQAQAMPLERKPITVTVTPDGAITIDSEPVTLDTLVSSVEALVVEGTDERIYVRGDATAAYGAIMEVMGALSAAGYGQIGLITERQSSP